MTPDLQALLAKLTAALAPSTSDRMNYGFPIQLTQAEANLLLTALSEARRKVVEAERERDEAREAEEQWEQQTHSWEAEASRVKAERDSALSELARLRTACAKENDEISQILGKALGYPWYKDDQEHFPGVTEADGVFVGEHVAITLVEEAAKALAKLRSEAE